MQLQMVSLASVLEAMGYEMKVCYPISPSRTTVMPVFMPYASQWKSGEPFSHYLKKVMCAFVVAQTLGNHLNGMHATVLVSFHFALVEIDHGGDCMVELSCSM
jgi:hypothetical protein